MMNTGAKFQFDTVFDVDENGRVRPDDRPKPQFTDEDLSLARGEGQQIGFDAGRHQALTEIESVAAQTLQAIAGELAQIGTRHQQAVLAIEADAARLALAIASKLAPALLAHNPLDEIETLIRRCLAEMPTEPRIVIRVAEPLVDALQDRVQAITAQSGFPGQLVLIGEPALTAADCRVEWADGGAERNLPSLQDRIDEAIARYCASLADQAQRLAAAEADAAADGAGETGTDAETPAMPTETPDASSADDVDDDPLEATLPEVQRGPAPAEGPAADEPADGVQPQE